VIAFGWNCPENTTPQQIEAGMENGLDDGRTGGVMASMTTTATKPDKPTSNKRWIVYLIALAVALAAARYFHLQDLLKPMLDWVRQLGPWGPVIFIGLYVLATVLFIPGSVLTLGAGAVFGVLWGSVYVSIAATLGATCAFLAGRYLARDAIARRIEGNPRFTALDQAVAREGWKIVLLMRLSPVFPFTLLNYGFGLTQVRLREYVLASWIGMMPGTVMYVYLGSLAGEASTPRSRNGLEWALYEAGLVATVAATLLITRTARKALSTRIEAQDR
jgi:uncharacterized membrane protein YdjX (TVP38/TMEM64 family)